MLSVAQILQNDWMTVNKDLEGDFSRHIWLEGLKDNPQYSWCLVQDSSRISSKQKSEEVLVERTLTARSY
jgi:hypothetical protein